MSVESISWALNLEDDRLTAVDRLVLIGIANHDGDGGAWPSVATLARYAAVQERSIGRSLARLEEIGYITRHVQQGGTTRTRAGQRPNLYELHRTPDRPVTPDRTVTPPPTEESGVPPTDGSGEPSIEPPVEPSNPPNPPQAGGVSEITPFDRWWNAYPRKVGKPTAERAFAKATKNMNEWREHPVFVGTHRWMRFWQDSGTDIQFIPHPATFLNQQRYNDTPPAPQRKPETGMEALRRIAARDHA